MKMNHEWLKDPAIFQVNRLKAVSSHDFYASEREMKERKSSYVHSLNGYWKFHYANSLNELIPEFKDPSYSCDTWDEIKVPGHIQLQGYGTPMYVNQVYPWSAEEEIHPGQIPEWNPVGSYVTCFDSSILKKDTDTRIVFHGVESGLALWVNGIFVGYSEDSFTPSAFDITDCIQQGRNRIAVNVYRFTSGSWLEDQDFWRFSGIFRDVELLSIPHVHINDIHLTQNMPVIGETAEVNLEAEVLSDTDDYEITCQLSDHDGNLLSEKSMQDGKVTFTIEHPELWYAERPYLYHVEIAVSFHGQTIECIPLQTGIRRFEMKDGIMCLNGKRIVFHGVNRHEFCCETGRTVSYEMTRHDIEIMKENNINAIRTSHYPNQEFLYDLCDEMGMYVIDETNLETHGTWSDPEKRKDVLPGSRSEWHDIVLDRARSMYERDKNHTCILIWSCGNESFGGKNIYDESEFFRKTDPSRLVHYEGVTWDPEYPDSTDMISQMYTPASDVEEILKKNPAKPFILCEYAHAMGNSNGALYKYTDLEDKYPKYQGGFIWDFVDQALMHDGHLCYGGDFRERPSDYDFCGNGLLFADRTVTPKMQEVKYCYQPFRMHITDTSVTFFNQYLYRNLSSFRTIFHLLKDGYETENVTLIAECPAGESVTVPLPFRIPDNRHEYAITVEVRDDHHEIAHEQKVFPYHAEMKHADQPIRIVEDFLNIGVRGEGFSVVYSKKKGLVSFKTHEKEMLRMPLRPDFFRASTNNDVENGYGYRYGQWLIDSLYASQVFDSIEKKETTCTIHTHYSLPSLKDNPLAVDYTVHGDGTVDVDMRLSELDSHIEMPCFGMLVETWSEMDQVSYYGMGPEENHIDRNRGALLGRYRYNAKDNITPYLYPQECGNRTGIREESVSDGNHSLTISADEFESSVLPYTPYVIENAAHQYELPVPYETVITIREKQMGIAGDNTWGARTHEEFLLSKKEHHFHFTLSAD